MTVTHYEYDADGRMVRSLAIPESEWSRADVALLLASRRSEQERGAHGIPIAEATDPANQFAFVGQKLPRVDFAEKARLDAQQAYYAKYDRPEDQGGPVNRNGHVWGVSKKPTT